MRICKLHVQLKSAVQPHVQRYSPQKIDRSPQKQSIYVSETTFCRAVTLLAHPGVGAVNQANFVHIARNPQLATLSFLENFPMSDAPDRSGCETPEQAASPASTGLAGELERLAGELRKALAEGLVPRVPSAAILERVEVLLARVQVGTEQNVKPEVEL
ncbi:hypothetical protein ACIA2T_04490 [Amycolatopsis japonica]|uniref:hypothetical protein n=1 Tax=Amycolatopsis japonica TaxID=208439 RepID=UPI0037A75867